MAQKISHELVTIQRSGNLISFGATEELYAALRPKLSYRHKTYYQGWELKQRKQQKRLNPSLPMIPLFDVEVRAMCDYKNGKILCAAGLKHRVVKFLEKHSIPWLFEDLRKRKLSLANYDLLLDRFPDLEFRFKQDEVLALIDSAEGGIIDAPTGFGKTFLATLICTVYPRDRICFLSPGIDLIKSTYARLLQVVPGDVGRVGGGFYEPDKRVTLGSVDSVHKIDLSKMNLIIGDEIHAFATPDRMNSLCSQYTDAKWIGFTASLNKRADGGDALIEALFGPVLTRITYKDAVEEGTVSDILAQFITLSRSEHSPILGEDMVSNKRIAYWCNRERNEKIAEYVRQAESLVDVKNPQIMIMVETVEHIFELKRFLPDFEPVYANLDVDTRERLLSRGLITEDEQMTPQRRQWLLKNFEDGTLKHVIANKCWKQGIDPKHLNIFVRADGGTSEIDSIQLPGRLSRVTSDKKEGLLLDIWDEWHPWALSRSKKREKSYAENGFKVLARI